MGQIDIKKQRSFTLMELLVVIIIVGVLVSFGVPTYTRAKEKGLDKQAILMIEAIKTGEKNYLLKHGKYFPSSGAESDISAINSNLSLDLIEDNWDCTIQKVGSDYFTSCDRTGGAYSNRQWQYDSSLESSPPYQCSGSDCL